MGWFFRKSIKFGPLRFNLSKSGVGVSAGVKGARVSVGPRGTYLNVGRGGLYYRQKLGSHQRSGAPREVNQIPAEAVEHAYTYLEFPKHGLPRIVKTAGLLLISAAIIALWVFALSQYTFFSNRIAAHNVAAPHEQAKQDFRIVNDFVNVAQSRPVIWDIVVPSGVPNARITGGYKVTEGSNVNFFIFNDTQYRRWLGGEKPANALAKHERSTSVRVNQRLSPGLYHLVFLAGQKPETTVTVAAELYLTYDKQ